MQALFLFVVHYKYFVFYLYVTERTLKQLHAALPGMAVNYSTVSTESVPFSSACASSLSVTC